jgi:hypothetical protein
VIAVRSAPVRNWSSGRVRDTHGYGQHLLDELIGVALRRFEREKARENDLKRNFRRRPAGQSDAP